METDTTERTNHTTGWTAQRACGGRSTRRQRNNKKRNNENTHGTIIHAQVTKQTKSKCGRKQRFQLARNAWATDRNSEPNKRIDRTFLSRHVFLKKRKTDSPIKTQSGRQRHLAVANATTLFPVLCSPTVKNSNDKRHDSIPYLSTTSSPCWQLSFLI